LTDTINTKEIQLDVMRDVNRKLAADLEDLRYQMGRNSNGEEEGGGDEGVDYVADEGESNAK
jgi:hypothetical protein